MGEIGAKETEAGSNEVLLWEVHTDKATDVLAFVNRRAGVKILVMPPEVAEQVGEGRSGQWLARRTGLRPGSAVEPKVIATGETEIDLVEKLEALLAPLDEVGAALALR